VKTKKEDQLGSSPRLPDQATRRPRHRNDGASGGSYAQRLPKARQLKLIWQHTAALLMEARESGKPEDLQHATGQLRRALDAEGWA
jgi:hypothetical protein